MLVMPVDATKWPNGAYGEANALLARKRENCCFSGGTARRWLAGKGRSRRTQELVIGAGGRTPVQLNP
jgi:hypothetical protein